MGIGEVVGAPYGWRARIGVVYPGSGAADPDYWSWVPPGVSVHFARVASSGDSSLAEIERLSDPELLPKAAQELAKIPVDAAVYACTSASFVFGCANDQRLTSVLGEAVGCPATTTSSAIVQALRHLDARRVAIAGPYMKNVVERFCDYLEEAAFTVVGSRALDLLSDRDLCGQDDESIYRFVKASFVEGADAIVVPETQFARNHIVPFLEDDLGVSVVTANIASMWDALRLAGVRWVRPGSGRLLA